MIIFNINTRVYNLISLLCVTGEYPVASLGILGDRTCYRRLVTNMCKMQTYHNSETGEKITCRALNISGKGKLKTLRLTKYALPLARWVEGAEFYTETHLKNNRSSNEQTVERHHRMAEAVAIIQQSGFEYRPWYLPKIQIENHQCSAIDEPSYFLPKVFRGDISNPSQKYTFSRVVGTLMTPNKTLMVYNTRNAIMKWDGQGESRTKINVENFSYRNTKKGEIDSAIIMGQNLNYVLGLIHQTEKQECFAIVNRFKNYGDGFFRSDEIPANQNKYINLCFNYFANYVKKKDLDCIDEEVISM